MQLDGLEGRVALVSGAARGIGLRICEVLAGQGVRVAAMDLAAPEIAGVYGLVADVTNPEHVDRAATEVESVLGPIDIVVLNAGILRFESLGNTSIASWEQTLAVNLTGAFICAQRTVPRMAESGWGRLIAIGSSAGKTGGAKDAAAYAASKAGIMTLAKSLASEFAGTGVTANAVAPALIATDMISGMPDMHSKVPIGRLGTPDDVASLVAFLASENASFITGEVVDINGGFFID